MLSKNKSTITFATFYLVRNRYYISDKWNPADMTFKEILQPTFAVCDMISMNPHCQINGTISLWNLNGLSMRHASALLWNGQWMDIISVFQVRLLTCSIQHITLQILTILLVFHIN